ncbi:HNH endonuclease [Metabacillus arenae]|uniref:HNH endonuclease n=1 Tax=Metabacillus arenae TaxID=2771434 RepID=A0A926NET0_9BACI|nr:HNH endonuclease [Metabacillus arenae]MBD1379153.1 HNH endonuclease [Metabacillus arenae]
MKICSIEGCNEKHEAKGYCKRHYRSFHKYGDPLQVEKNKQKETRPYNLKAVKIPYEENHKTIDGIEHKLCRHCEEWIPMNEEYFYKKKANKTDGFDSYCKECVKEKSSKWVDENRDRHNENQLKYFMTDKGREAKNRELATWRANGGQKRYYKKNKVKLRKNAELRKMNKEHTISKNEWENCKNYFHYRCAYCNLPIEDHFIKQNENIMIGDFHKEHVNHNGANDLSNCVPSCKVCNTTKHDTEFEEWYNEDNKNFSQGRLDKIIKWLHEDHKQYIEPQKPKRKYTKRSEKWFSVN